MTKSKQIIQLFITVLISVVLVAPINTLSAFAQESVTFSRNLKGSAASLAKAGRDNVLPEREKGISTNQGTSLTKANDQKQPKINSYTGIVIDADTGAILYSKRINKKMYPASTTKMLTGLLAVENGDLDKKFKFTKKAIYSIEAGSSSIGMLPGEKMTLRDALYGMLLASANEISNGIAEDVGGSIENFVKMMNIRAKELGCENSHFVNPNGLNDKNHYTTAYDLALITREAIRHEDLQKIISTPYARLSKTNKIKYKRYLTNHNKMILKNSKYYYKYCKGGKTGYTTAAHHTLINTAQKGNRHLICVVMKSQGRESKWKDDKELFDFCFKNFTDLHTDNVENFDLKNSVSRLLKNRGWLENGVKFSVEPTIISLPKNYNGKSLSVSIIEDKLSSSAIPIAISYNGTRVGSTIAKLDRPFVPDTAKGENEVDNKEHRGVDLVKVLIGAISLITILIIAFFVRRYIHLKRHDKLFRDKYSKMRSINENDKDEHREP